MPKIAPIESVKIPKIVLFFSSYITVGKTDLYLSYFNLSYVFPGKNDSVKRGPTVLCVDQIDRGH